MVDKAFIIKDFTETMKNHYGDRLSKIILYGSYARGDFNEESDIDFLVLLNDEEVRTSKEILNTYKLLYHLTLENNIEISLSAASQKKYELATKAFYRFIKNEGITVYE
ncbi:MAG: nucleotidyltransferase domain-containing protein [Arcicella sp.]|nr:nucleotidyltransferase domain-containing protein [Arcicella sp.]